MPKQPTQAVTFEELMQAIDLPDTQSDDKIYSMLLNFLRFVDDTAEDLQERLTKLVDNLKSKRPKVLRKFSFMLLGAKIVIEQREGKHRC